MKNVSSPVRIYRLWVCFLATLLLFDLMLQQKCQECCFPVSLEMFARLVKSKQNCLSLMLKSACRISNRWGWYSFHGLIWREASRRSICSDAWLPYLPLTAWLATLELVILLPLCLIPECLGVKYLLQHHLHTSFSLPLKEKSPFGHLSYLDTDFIVILPKGIIQDVLKPLVLACKCLK